MNTLTNSFVNNYATTFEVFGNSVGTVLREFLVESRVSFRRSCTYDLYTDTGVNGIESFLGFLGQSRLTLSEGYEYEVFNFDFLTYGNFLGNYFFNDLLLNRTVAEVVDDAVQTVNFFLIVEFGNGEVVGSVRVLELVDETGVQLNESTVEIVFNTALAYSGVVFAVNFTVSVIQAPNNCRLYIELPCLVITQVEHEVQTGFRGNVVAVGDRRNLNSTGNSIHFVVGVTEYVSPAKTINTDYFEAAGFTGIATEPVAEVNGSQERGVQETNESMVCSEGLV